MARILSDREIKSLLGSVILGGDKLLVNPNGIELRLGSRVRFLVTSEEREISDGGFLRVSPGESVIIVSLESLDFSKAKIAIHYPGCSLMAFITPTTTMMREGIMQAATKVDAGFCGQLNWGLRNSSGKDLLIQRGEPLFKLTFLLLEGDEVPDSAYGERPGDKYQNTKGVLLSARRVPADIPKDKIVASSFEKLDHKKQLKEAGYPFSHIGSELMQLQGKFELVSTDVRVMKETFDDRTGELSKKIETETAAVLERLEEHRTSLKEHAESLFSRKFGAVVGTIIGAITLLFGIWGALQAGKLKAEWAVPALILSGVAVLLITWILTRRVK